MKNAELYATLKNTDNLHNALVEHFAYLADSDGLMPVLEKIMSMAKSVELEENNLIIYFPGKNFMTCHEPVASGYEKYPPSFQKIVSHHEYISFPDDGWAMMLGESGNFEPEMFEEGDSDLVKQIANVNDILCPFTDYSDWWIYHPTKKNPQGEPMLCLASHASDDIEEEVTCNIGSLFLKRAEETLEDVEEEDEENKNNASEVDIDWGAQVEQAVIDAGGGLVGTIIKQDCEYAVYKSGVALYLYYPDGHIDDRVNWNNERRADIAKAIKDIENTTIPNGELNYVVWLDGKRVGNTQPGNRVTIYSDGLLGWDKNVDFGNDNLYAFLSSFIGSRYGWYVGNVGGWDKEGRLITAVKADNRIYVRRPLYVGYVKNGEIIFDENCGLE